MATSLKQRINLWRTVLRDLGSEQQSMSTMGNSVESKRSSARPDLDEYIPEVVVGIDFGMTCTGVAYSIGPEWSPPKILQHWPGKQASELSNKVPTCVEYDLDSTDVKQWGFSCDHDDSLSDIKEYFKLYLSHESPQSDPEVPTRHQAQQWFYDYIRSVYKYAVKSITNVYPLFPSRRVEFNFSVPTTWKDPRTIAEIKDLLERAIISSGSNYRVAIGLTEAEAAAVYALKHNYHSGNVVLVCDAGGGTTDANVLRLVSHPDIPVTLEQLTHVEGIAVGSTFIDKDVDELLCQKLERIKSHLKLEPEEISWKLINDRFQRFKWSFGTEAASIPTLKLDVPFMEPSSNFPEADIYNGQINIDREDIQLCFDKQVDRIYKLIDRQIYQTKTQYPQEQIACIILSGGLGSSEYIQKCLTERYGGSAPETAQSTRGMQVIPVDEPQTAVVRGLVMQRIQEIQLGVSSIRERRAPISYGIVHDEPYDSQKHTGQPMRLDRFDGKKYATDQIHWILFQGEPIPSDGIFQTFHKKLHPNLLDVPWRLRIVTSALMRDKLPQNISQDDTTVVCELSVNMDVAEKRLKNAHWYSWKPAYWKADFDIRFIIESADLDFQLWSNGRRIQPSVHKAVSIKWDPVSTTLQ